MLDLHDADWLAVRPLPDSVHERQSEVRAPSSPDQLFFDQIKANQEFLSQAWSTLQDASYICAPVIRSVALLAEVKCVHCRILLYRTISQLL